MAGSRRRGLARTVKLASLPVGIMTKRMTALGKGFVTGAERGRIDEQLIAEAAEQVFTVLGELKGGAMKLGQMLSVAEVAIPPQFADRYRQALVKLQSQAPPMPVASVHKMLDQQLGTRWRERFRSFEDEPVAAASIGQVHRGVWSDGRAVAVKVQYPGADDALRADLRMMQLFSGAFTAFLPGVDVKAMIDELVARTEDELDYRIEAGYQRLFAKALTADDPQFRAPKVIASSPKVMVSEWMDGISLTAVIAEGTKAQRDSAAMLLAEFLLCSPPRFGHLHSDPHPGNFMLLPDGRLGVIDFGATTKLPEGIPPYIGEILRTTLASDYDGLHDTMVRSGFVKPGASMDMEPFRRSMGPLIGLAQGRTFHFTRQVMQDQVARELDPQNFSLNNLLAISVPADRPELAMLARVFGGLVGICTQLDAEGPFFEIVARWLPGFPAEGEAA